jgi:hypothetical protein
MSVDLLTDAKPFDLWPQVPPSIQAIMPNVTWNRARLHALSLPVRHVPVAQLRWQLALPWWRHGDRVFAITPNQVRDDPERFVVQWRRVLDADLDYPINLLERNGLVLLDGVHRLLKADVLEMPTISAHVLDLGHFAEVVERVAPCPVEIR